MSLREKYASSAERSFSSVFIFWVTITNDLMTNVAQLIFRQHSMSPSDSSLNVFACSDVEYHYFCCAVKWFSAKYCIKYLL